jgi:predicted transcriptional regulator
MRLGQAPTAEERSSIFSSQLFAILDTLPTMKTKKLTEILERVEAWPPHIQNELAEFALELDAGLKDGEYEPTPEELAGIDRGLRAAQEGRFASDRQVEAVFAKFRGK